MLIDRRWIEDHIPHAGKMCLLDEVLEWDASRIRCRGSSHRNADNPLRSHGRLGAACGIEYAAQSMAIHGALIATAEHGRTPVGYLASVRGVTLFAKHLDDVQADLIAAAERITSDSATVLYEFSVAAADRVLLAGRATIVFDIARQISTP